MPESEALKKYRDLHAELIRLAKKVGWGSDALDAQLDKMDQPWWDLTDIGDQESPQC